ncbi:MAG: tetratricopeptide repeat protein [Candidatus Latescibacterota bacterium]
MSACRDWLGSEWGRQCLVCLAAAVVYAGMLGNGFAHDAGAVVRDNPIVARGSLAQIATTDYWAGYHGDVSGLYRPLTVLSFALNRRLLGPGPAGHHLVDLALHALATLLLYRLVRSWSGRRELAGWTALLFAVHPAASEAVASVVGRADLLVAASAFAAVRLHLLGRQRPGWRAPAGAALALSLGLLCKESALCVPALLALAEALQYRGFGVRRHTHLAAAVSRLAGGDQTCGSPAVPDARPIPARPPAGAAVWGLYLAVVVAYLALRQAVLGGLTVGPVDRLDNPLVELGPVLLRLNAVAVLWRYGGLLAFPAPLCADYSYAALSLERTVGLAALLPLVAGLAALGLFLTGWRRRPWLAGGVAWILLSLLPVANLVVPIGTIMAERALYLPAAGFALALAALLADGVARHRAARLSACLVPGVWAVLAAQRSGDWESDYTLFAQAVEVRPGSARAWRALGRAALEHGDEAGGMAALEQALRILPDYHEVHGDLGVLLLEHGQAARALEPLAAALRLAPGDPTLWYNAGLAHHRLGERDAAREAFARAVQLDAAYVKAHYNLGVVLLEDGRLQEAAAAFTRVLALEPGHDDAAANLEALRQALGTRRDR